MKQSRGDENMTFWKFLDRNWLLMVIIVAVLVHAFRQ